MWLYIKHEISVSLMMRDFQKSRRANWLFYGFIQKSLMVGRKKMSDRSKCESQDIPLMRKALSVAQIVYFVMFTVCGMLGIAIATHILLYFIGGMGMIERICAKKEKFLAVIAMRSAGLSCNYWYGRIEKSSISSDTIATARQADRVTRYSPTVNSAARQGTLYHDAVGQGLAQSGNLSS